MNVAQRLFCRVYQGAFRLALPLLPYREPRLYDSVSALEPMLKELRPAAALVVTDRGLWQAGITRPVEALLTGLGIRCVIYDGTSANPTVSNVEAARQLYVEGGCECIIAIGGGSPMDCAKGVGARIAYPKKTLAQLKGLLRVLRRIPTLIAIPTTAGTGSEVTLAAVLTDDVKRHKYTMNDFTLIPRHAVLDAELTRSLPQHLTATTGMDALTHAVEAYIGRSTTRQTRALAQEAVGLIFRSLERAYNNGNDLEARADMLRASYAAGIAFSKSYVGYVHAVAHSLGGQYSLPHGLTNAVLLPIVLEAYGQRIHRKLYDLAVAAGVADRADTPAQAARKFIAAVRAMNARMGIPSSLPGILRTDIPLMAAHAAREANPLYPVPVLMDAKELEVFYYSVADWRNEP